LIKTSRLFIAILVAIGLGACSSAGGTGTFAPGARDAAMHQRSESTLILRIRIPKHKKTQRGARYISAATKGLLMTFTGASTVAQAVNLTPADPRCAGSPVVCAFSIDLAPGAYTASVTTYDEAPVNGAIPAGAKLLSTDAGVPVSATPGTANLLRLTLDGVPASIVLPGLAPADAGSGFFNKAFSVSVLDADGFTIVGTYTTPITLSNSDATGITEVTTSGSDNPPARTLLSSADTPALSYSGQAVNAATITASAGSIHGSFLFEVFLPLYVADTSNMAVKEIPIGCTYATCIITIGGGFSTPTAVTSDASGNVYVSDYGHNAVKKIPAGCYDSTCVLTIGGGFSLPYGIAIDHAGEVFVADFGNNAVKKIPPGCTSATCVVVAGGGFHNARGVTVSPSGTVFVADTNDNLIKSMATNCTNAQCVSTRSTGTALQAPTSIALDGANNVYVAEPTSNIVREVPAGCNVATCVVTIGGGFSSPYGVTADWQGDVFVADTGNNATKSIPPGCIQSVCVNTFGGGFSGPYDIGIF
jgi:hypothetical protein